MKLYVFLFMLSSLIGDVIPVTISTPGVNAESSRIGIDSSANITAIWLEGGVIKGRTKPYQGNWNSVETIASSSVTDLNLVVNDTGTATAVWLENGVVKTAEKLPGGSWGPTTSLSGSGASSPYLIGDVHDNLITVWITGGNVESATKLSGGSWPPSPDVISATDPATPKASIGDDGTALVVWSDYI